MENKKLAAGSALESSQNALLCSSTSTFNFNSTRSDDSSIWAGSIVRGDLFQSYCNHIFWSNASPKADMDFPAGSVVFCKIDEVLNFFEKLRLTRKLIILITGEGDFPCDAFRQRFLPKNVIHWFATNVTHPHPRVTALPLGLGTPKDCVTLNESELLAAAKKETSKDHWLFVSFRPETNRCVRQKIYTHFQEQARHETWITFHPPSSKSSHELFLKELTRHRFILCPPGNGVDTHRMWEALAAGTYPIVFSSAAMKPFEELPILFVEDVEKITLPFLQENLQQLEAKKKNLFMTQISFWQKKIETSQQALQRHPSLSLGEWLSESFWYGLGLIQRRVLKKFFFHELCTTLFHSLWSCTLLAMGFISAWLGLLWAAQKIN